MAVSRGLLLVLANVLIPVAILTFAIGFFPYKPFLPGLAQFNQGLYPEQPDAPFDKLIFMVVDALRSDFVYSEGTGFTFVQSLIRDGSAIPFTAHATSPTITMPRIKAITTGSTPSFLDLILNFAESDTSSSLAGQDTWLAQMKAKGTGSVVMYGDDTWLKLFPTTFDRADGTSSFFVADFTEVDNNVTRHVPTQLQHHDWNTMVLHYLGLDHIGHKTGPRSPHMIPKQKEMDSIVQQMYNAIENNDHLSSTLLVLCGDHGMNDAGNHGGSAAGETSPAMLFASPKLKSISSGQRSPVPPVDDFQYHTRIEQSDIVPTLGGLLGFPVPKNNLGAFITDFLPLWPQNHRLQLLLQNALQILSIVTATSSETMFSAEQSAINCSDPSSDMEQLACDWHTITTLLAVEEQNSEQNHSATMASLTLWLKDAQGIMSGAASDYDLAKLIGGQVVAGFALMLSIAAAWPSLAGSPRASMPFALVTLTYGILMFASSYVEEEHHFWYWMTSGWFLYLAARGIAKSKRRSGTLGFSIFIALIALRTCRRWNQTGQKFAGEPDIARTFMTQHNNVLWVLVTATYAWVTLRLTQKGFPSLSARQSAFVAVILFILAMNFKVAFTLEDAPEQMAGIHPSLFSVLSKGSGLLDLVANARVIFCTLAFCLVYTIVATVTALSLPVVYRKASLFTVHNLLAILCLTQSRTPNVPLFLLFSIIATCLSQIRLSLVEITTTTLLLQHVSFFASGGSNAISSIDLSLAYNGVSGYNAVAVGFLTFIGNWAGAVWWGSFATQLLVDYFHRQRTMVIKKYAHVHKDSLVVHKIGIAVQQQHIALLTLFVAAHLVFVMAACTALRTHLFIWTVFSPKFLYSMAWSLGLHFIINIGLGSGLFMLARG